MTPPSPLRHRGEVRCRRAYKPHDDRDPMPTRDTPRTRWDHGATDDRCVRRNSRAPSAGSLAGWSGTARAEGRRSARVPTVRGLVGERARVPDDTLVTAGRPAVLALVHPQLVGAVLPRTDDVSRSSGPAVPACCDHRTGATDRSPHTVGEPDSVDSSSDPPRTPQSGPALGPTAPLTAAPTRPAQCGNQRRSPSRRTSGRQRLAPPAVGTTENSRTGPRTRSNHSTCMPYRPSGPAGSRAP